MVGDIADMTARLRSVLPGRWFPDSAPNLSALLTSLATPWSWLYSLVQFIFQQARIATATEEWLDLIALDFFGDMLIREIGETDAAYRGRIQVALLQGAATRPAVVNAITLLTGVQPVIFEPSKPADTGAYGANRVSQPGVNLAYGQVGGWGNLDLPYQFFATITRPRLTGVSLVSGYGVAQAGYGTGPIAYVDLAMLVGNVSDATIAAHVCQVLPVNTTAWIRLK